MNAVYRVTENGRPKFRFGDVPEPQVQAPNHVKIRVHSVGVCASDIHALHGTMNVPEGNIVGHEFAGIVVEAGSGARGIEVGDRVVSELALGKCGTCDMCRSGRYEFCRSKRPQGWVSPGVYSEYTVSEADIIHRIPDGVALDLAALAEPIAICVYGCLERAAMAAGQSVVIYGMGSIGLLTLIVLLDAGMRDIICVTPTGRSTLRRDTAVAIGAAKVVTPDEDLRSALTSLTGRPDPDVVVDCSGSPSAINAGMELLGKDGTFVALGIAADDTIPFVFNAGIHKALRLVFSSTSSHTSWVRSLEILARQHDRLQHVVTDVLPLDQWHEGYRRLEAREAIKVILRP